MSHLLRLGTVIIGESVCFVGKLVGFFVCEEVNFCLFMESEKK